MSETFGKTLTCSSSRGVDNVDDFSGVIFKAGLRIDAWGKGNSGRNRRRSEEVCNVDCKADGIVTEGAEEESDSDENSTSVSEAIRSKLGK